MGDYKYLALWICLLTLRIENKSGFGKWLLYKKSVSSVNSKTFPIEHLIIDCELAMDFVKQ